MDLIITDPVYADRFWSKVEPAPADECWIWKASKTAGGYGQVGIHRKRYYAHRVAYEAMRAEIPAGLHIDHLCRNRACVNPWHLEPVTNRENGRRGMAGYGLRTDCVRGHDITNPENVLTNNRGHRRCRTCRDEDNAARPLSPRGRAEDRTHCPRGHEYSPENTYVKANGHRRCRVCTLASNKASKSRRGQGE